MKRRGGVNELWCEEAKNILKDGQTERRTEWMGNPFNFGEQNKPSLSSF